MNTRSIRVLIVGAGIGGLTCAVALARHGIIATVIEQKQSVSPAGNGIQLPPNASLAMKSLGLLERLLMHGGKILDRTLSLNWSDGRVLLNRDSTNCEEIYGAPWILIHRADYVKVLHEEALRLGVQIHTNCMVIASCGHLGKATAPQDGHLPQELVVLGRSTEGHRYFTGDVDPQEFDVVIGFDGLRSMVAQYVDGNAPYLVAKSDSGLTAYRCTMQRTHVEAIENVSVRALAGEDGSICRIWLGYAAHVVFYAVRGGEVFNLVVVVRSMTTGKVRDGDEESRQEESRVVAGFLDGWDPTLLAIIHSVKRLDKFKLYAMPKRQTWHFNNTIILGDAAHAALPFLGQGAAMAVEDALFVGTLLGRYVSNPNRKMNYTAADLIEDVSTLVAAVEDTQMPRCDRVVEKSALNGKFNHLEPESEECKKRNTDYAAWELKEMTSNCPWIDAEFNAELLGRNTEEAASKKLDEIVMEGKLRCFD